MRYSRLKERIRPWTEKDVSDNQHSDVAWVDDHIQISALTRAKADVEKSKWESVATGML
ncbi:hypothetical protein V491_04683, partial [Pseudogymnoascus sp. VKM F-3775]